MAKVILWLYQLYSFSRKTTPPIYPLIQCTPEREIHTIEAKSILLMVKALWKNGVVSHPSNKITPVTLLGEAMAPPSILTYKR